MHLSNNTAKSDRQPVAGCGISEASILEAACPECLNGLTFGIPRAFAFLLCRASRQMSHGENICRRCLLGLHAGVIRLASLLTRSTRLSGRTKSKACCYASELSTSLFVFEVCVRFLVRHAIIVAVSLSSESMLRAEPASPTSPADSESAVLKQCTDEKAGGVIRQKMVSPRVRSASAC